MITGAVTTIAAPQPSIVRNNGRRSCSGAVARVSAPTEEKGVESTTVAEIDSAMRDDSVDAVIVTHGTDTAEETAFLLDRVPRFWGNRLGAVAGQGLDAPDAGRHGAFADDLEDPDVAGAFNVGAAAKLGGEGHIPFLLSHRDDAHFVPVFLAEQR